jgi:hypothetical protein
MNVTPGALGIHFHMLSRSPYVYTPDHVALLDHQSLVAVAAALAVALQEARRSMLSFAALESLAVAGAPLASPVATPTVYIDPQRVPAIMPAIFL